MFSKSCLLSFSRGFLPCLVINLQKKGNYPSDHWHFSPPLPSIPVLLLVLSSPGFSVHIFLLILTCFYLFPCILQLLLLPHISFECFTHQLDYSFELLLFYLSSPKQQGYDREDRTLGASSSLLTQIMTPGGLSSHQCNLLKT